MTHDTEAAWATSNIAQQIMRDNELCFSNNDQKPQAFALIPKRKWPIPDGLIKIKTNAGETTENDFAIALEYKRPEESIHGVLTALGQSISYIEQGYSGSIIVAPRSYDSQSATDIGEFITNVLNYSCGDKPIGVFVYDAPDQSSPSPFEGRLECVRRIDLDASPSNTSVTKIAGNPAAQWAYMREGETTPDVIFRYLQTAKTMTDNYVPTIIDELRDAVGRAYPEADPVKWLCAYPQSFTVSRKNEIFKRFWFDFVLTEDVQKIWNRENDTYVVNHVPTKLVTSDGIPAYKLSGKSNSIKNIIVEKLNNNEINEDDAWELFVKNINNGRDGAANSYKKTVPLGIKAFELINEFERPTKLGYKFVDECEKNNNNANGLIPMNILRFALLKNGRMDVFLDSVFKVSEEKFRTEPDAFVVGFEEGKMFCNNSYLNWLENEFIDTLRILNKKEKAREIFQGERTLLKQCGFISGNIRRGLGFEINWPIVQRTLESDVLVD